MTEVFSGTYALVSGAYYSPQTRGIDGMINTAYGYAFDAVRGGERKGLKRTEEAFQAHLSQAAKVTQVSPSQVVI